MRVLVATDGSECAAVAIDLAADIAWPAGSTIHLVQAVESGVVLFGGPWPPTPAVDTTRVDVAVHQLAEQNVNLGLARLVAPDLEVVSAVAQGRAPDVIVHRAEAHGVDLIVVGSRGHGTFESMLLGSVSAEVIDHAPVPVLVARGRRIDRVVLGWDGSAGARRAADLLTAWPIFADSDVRVVSVADASPQWWTGMDGQVAHDMVEAYESAADSSRAQHHQLAQDMADVLVEGGLRAEPDRRDGDPATQIVAAANGWDADLIVIGTHGRTGLRRLLVGSVARNVLHHAHCSVLVAREDAES